MTSHPETASQTAGPYVHIGCTPNFAGIDGVFPEDLGARMITGDASGERITLTGQIFDGTGTSLRDAMIEHPRLVSGEGRACALLMEAAKGQAAVKTGAEGVFVAILPGQKLGIALKIEDGATRASEIAMAALLARLGVIDVGHPILCREIRNWDGLLTGKERAVPNLLGRSE